MSQLHASLLIWELSTVDRETSGPISSSEVTTLRHEVGDDAMEVTLLVSKALSVITRTQRSEVFCSLWDLVLVEL